MTTAFRWRSGRRGEKLEAAGVPVTSIFLSYRREDAAGYAGRLADDIGEQFPTARIFRDVESIQAGADFRSAIQQALSWSVACIVLIGPRWLSIVGDRGHARLYDPWDFVRLEIGTALARGMLVIPVLIDTKMPPPHLLPDDLKALTARHAHELSDQRWDYDVDRLCDALAPAMGPEKRVPRRNQAAPVSPPRSGMKWAFIWAMLGAVVCVVVLGIVGNCLPSDSHDPSMASGSVTPLAPPVMSVPAPSQPPALSLANIEVCTTACGALAEQCTTICGGGNACHFCAAEGKKCQEQCSVGDCNPACTYNDRCQGLNDTSDPRACCPPTVLNDPGSCARQLAPPAQAGR